ncbi:MAG: phosphotransferase family protein [Candidatus Limnocylindria bacterium]
MTDRYRPTAPDVERVRDLLRSLVGADVMGVETIRPGEWSSAYRAQTRSGALVVRYSSLREDFDKDRVAARWSSEALPVPRILHLGEAQGGWVAVSESLPGGHLDALDELGVRAVLPSLFGALDALRVLAPAGDGYGGWDGSGHAPHSTWQDYLLDVALDDPKRRAYGWRPLLAASSIGTSLFDEAFDRMRRLLDLLPDSRHVIHSDLVNRNVLVEGVRITAVLDWGSSIYGDFLLDLAWITYFAPWFKQWSGVDFEAEAARHYAVTGLEVPHLAERLRCYELYIGLSHLAYSAFRERPEAIEWNARRTREVLASLPS